jgi:hypothetical protein
MIWYCLIEPQQIAVMLVPVYANAWICALQWSYKELSMQTWLL